MSRQYDVVLYGASGFTGRQTVQYFAAHAPDTLCWAIAGRNKQKLEAVRAQVGCDAIDILVADGRDQVGVDAIASSTRIIASTAGPFALYSQPLVDACVRHQTHYVDITGETPWIRHLIDRYHRQAAAQGTRIIPCCGFDSVPSDLGTYLIVRSLQQQGVACQTVKAYFEAAGGFNGGTLASAVNLVESGQWQQMQDLYLLNPPETAPEHPSAMDHDPHWPHYDSEGETWVAPFFMSPVNTRVVRRSSALYSQWQVPYGMPFSYQEYLSCSGPLAAFSITSMTGVFATLIQQPLIRRFLPRPGDGPSEDTMNEGWFRCRLIGIGDDGRQIQGMIYNQGDPGNRSTVLFLCESALALALDRDKLSGGPQRGGVLTPATGLGDVLAERLRCAGTVIDIAA